MAETQRLAALQDIDLMIRERKNEEELGFSTEGLETLEEARAKLAAEVDSRLLRLYERLAKRYDRAVVPVVEHRCVGSLPDGRGSDQRHESPGVQSVRRTAQ